MRNLVITLTLVSSALAQIYKPDGLFICDYTDPWFTNPLPVCCEGFTGSYCRDPICTDECQNGGRCIEPDVCQCLPGYSGDNCGEALAFCEILEQRYLPGEEFQQDCNKCVCRPTGQWSCYNDCDNEVRKTRCWEESVKHSKIPWKERQRVYKPTCQRDGSYTILQCNYVSRTCYCVQRWSGEKDENTETLGIPDCSSHQVADHDLTHDLPDVRPKLNLYDETQTLGNSKPCLRDLENYEKLNAFQQYFYTKPKCTASGHYVNRICNYLLGSCECIDRNTGLIIPGTKTFRKDLDCDDVRVPDDVETDETTTVAVVTNPEVPSGCVFEDKYYEKDEQFYPDCNVCTCEGHNVAVCSRRECLPAGCYVGNAEIKIYEHIHEDECYTCNCQEGEWDCLNTGCDETGPSPIEDDIHCDVGDERHEVGDIFFMECNECYCSETGQHRCTKKACPEDTGRCWLQGHHFRGGFTIDKQCEHWECVNGQWEIENTCQEPEVSEHVCEVAGETHPVGEPFFNRCNRCICHGQNVFSCEENECDASACYYKGNDFYDGESIIIEHKICQCSSSNWECGPFLPTDDDDDVDN